MFRAVWLTWGSTGQSWGDRGSWEARRETSEWIEHVETAISAYKLYLPYISGLPLNYAGVVQLPRSSVKNEIIANKISAAIYHRENKML